MKIFLDTASLAAVRQWQETGLINGVTTNPTHLSKEGGNSREHILALCALLPQGEISVEVTEKDPQAVYKQARAIVELAGNIIVKVPCHRDYYAVIKQLVADKIKINITLLFSLSQALFMSKLGVHYLSPFVGRLNDSGGDGYQLLCDIRAMLDGYGFTTQLLAASLRDVGNLNQAIACGAHAATLPPEVMEKATKHTLTDKGIELFNADWKKLNNTQFP